MTKVKERMNVYCMVWYTAKESECKANRINWSRACVMKEKRSHQHEGTKRSTYISEDADVRDARYSRNELVNGTSLEHAPHAR